MATKTITVTEDAYERLARLKREGESFSELINRITAPTSPLQLSGILGPEEGSEIRGAIGEVRSEIEDRVDRTAEELNS